jgi:hypothetical protein
MPVSVTASLVGTYSPRTVQVVVSGMTAGTEYEVTGSWAGGSWAVRAGTGVAAGAQVVLADLSTPINVPITYTVVHGAETATSASIVVDYPYRHVLQSLSGDTSVPTELVANGAPRSLALRQSAFQIPGRTRPVVVYDIAGGESGQFVMDTHVGDTAAFKAMLKTGAPLLLRTDGQIVDLEAAAFLSVTGADSSLVSLDWRRWNLSYELIDDPEPSTLVGLPTWDDFDVSYTSDPVLIWDSFDAEWAGSTWDDFDVYDWATRAAS